MHEIDPILFRWGLHQLIDPSLDSNYPCIQNQLDAEVGGMQHANGSNIREDCTSVENDEVIAHALQEELSQVALAEASRHSYGADEEQLHACVLAQNWINKEYLGDEPPKRVLDDKDSSTCSIPDDNLPNNEMRSLQLTDDFSTLDGEVYKRFNQMTSIPHVPKINGVIPTDDEATSDHQRLLDRLKVYDLVEFKIQGDGNCQFRALSDQFYRSPEHHMVVRQQIVKQLKSHPTMYEGYVPMAFDDYIKKMSKSGEWGDHVTLQAAADSYGVKIFILTSFKDTCYIEILPAVQKSERVICLSFWAEVHYNSIYPEEELPISEAKKKRRWWHIRL